MTLKIKALRKAKGLSQQMLADMAGVSRSQFSEIETGSRPANTLRLSAIAKALGVSVTDLFEGGSKESYVNELRDLLDGMSEDDREAIMRLAKSLSRQ